MPDRLPFAESRRPLLICCLWLMLIPRMASAGERMDFRELMKIRKITTSAISDNGEWLAYVVRPDRGDGEGIVSDARGRHKTRVPGASGVAITVDGGFATFVVGPTFEEREILDKEEWPQKRVVLVRTSDGQTLDFDRVKSSAFSKDGKWWVRHLEEAKDAADDSTQESGADLAEAADDSTAEDEAPDREAGTPLVLRRLADGEEWEIASVARYGFDPTSQHLAVVIATESGEENSLRRWSLADTPTEEVVHSQAMAAYPAMAWARDLPALAFVVGDESEPGEIQDLRLHVFVDADREVASAADLPEGMDLAEENELTWSLDAKRLFFGMLPKKGDSSEDAEAETPFDPYDFDAILEGREVDVWNWRDPRIKTHEKSSWEDRSKAQRLAVVHLDRAKVVALADELIPVVPPELEASRILASTEVPYLRQQTWGWFYEDYYLIDLETGERRRMVARSSDPVTMSEDGSQLAFYREGRWQMIDVASGEARVLTADIETPFADEDHDYPFPTPGYGSPGWIRGGGGVLVYDKYDIWRFGIDGGAPLCLTQGQGRAEHLQFRVLDLDPEVEGFDEGSMLLLSAFDEDTKASFFYEVSTDGRGLKQLYGGDMRLRYRAKAKDTDRLVFTEENYDRFPDLWTATTRLKHRRRVSEVNPQLEHFDLGSSELVEWLSLDGIPTQGVLIKPPDYDPDRRYPVLVYYYRFFSQRLHEFNDPVINHRPSFYVYAGDDYCVFLPDIRFEIGRPGLAATKSLVPGVQMLVDRGIADPRAVALHGHSWSGYQTAQMITQTDFFACAVAGAPVSNMTSAYGGIRWGSGMSRQFQYEMGQSRIGATLWNGLDRYIDNSPVFFADRIHTPLLIEFEDEDEAVPWTQGIELYMAMRRLDRPCVMLQYRGEPHHLKKFPNKLDYSLKMKAFIDHFCKGEPAPEWWTEGVPYEGE